MPKESIKKRSLDDILDRQIRVQQAVAACKEGKMSQSSAASHFEASYFLNDFKVVHLAYKQESNLFNGTCQ